MNLLTFKVKEELMHKFMLTKQGFRMKFRTVGPEKGEMPHQFGAKIENYYDRWIDLSRVDRTFEGLRDLMLCEQFMNCCNKDLLTYLKEKECSKFSEVLKWAKTYVQAHGLHSFTMQSRSSLSQDKGRNGNNLNLNKEKVSLGQNNLQKGGSQGQSPKPLTGQGRGLNSEGRRTGRVSCYICAGNHYARDCTQKKSPQVAQGLMNHVTLPIANGSPTQGHWVMWVPEGQMTQEDSKSSNLTSSQSDNTGVLGACLEINQSEISNNDGRSEDLHKLGMAYDEVGALFKSMPIVSGRLMPDNIPVSVLRDSGCSTCVVRSDLVKPEQMTDKVNSVVLIDGTVRQFPVARVRVDSPYLSSEVEALCMPNSLCEVVIGNIEGAREPGNPNLDWKPKEDIQNDLGSTQDIKIDEVELVEEGLAVQTREQVERSKGNLKPLKVIGSIPEVTPQELTVAQKDDDIIRHLWEKVKSEDKSSKYIFVIDKGWLCRQLLDVDDPSKGSGPKALVVPNRYRDQIMKVAHESLLQGHLGVKNTLTKIQSQFYWPGIVDSVYRFCRSGDLCQKTIDKVRVPRAPLGRMPLIPFQRVAIDLVGPLSPPSE